MLDVSEKVVPVQRMFPNCQKYSKCCRMDKPFWDELEAKLKQIEYKKQPFRLKNLLAPISSRETPEDFKGW